MERIFWCLGASALLLSGCNRANQTASEPAPQKISEAAPTSVAVNEPANEPTAVPIRQVTPGAGDELVADETTNKRVAALDIKQFKIARTLELPYYRDGVHYFAFSPDGKTLAGAGQGYVFSASEGGERGVVFLFDAKSGALLKRLASKPLSNSSGYGPNLDRVIWSPDGKSVAAWNVDSYGSEAGGAPLCVWDVESGKRTAAFRSANWVIATVAWMRDGSLLVARNNQPKPGNLAVEGQLMVCNGRTGQINNVYDLGKQSVAAMNVPQQGMARLLILKSVGEPKTYNGPDLQSYVCLFDDGVLSQPLLQFKVREVYFASAFAQNGLVALAGFEQLEQDDPNGIGAALYAVVDLKTGKIVWQTKRKSIDFSYKIVLLPGEKKLRAFTVNRHDDFVFDMKTGKTSVAPNTDRRQFPFFAPDGKRFVRTTDFKNRGQKPNLKIAEIWER